MVVNTPKSEEKRRWAGAAFCNSPAPSTLPMPIFVDTILPYNANNHTSGLSQSGFIPSSTSAKTSKIFILNLF
jgi:hypothetical protein